MSVLYSNVTYKIIRKIHICIICFLFNLFYFLLLMFLLSEILVSLEIKFNIGYRLTGLHSKLTQNPRSGSN